MSDRLRTECQRQDWRRTNRALQPVIHHFETERKAIGAFYESEVERRLHPPSGYEPATYSDRHNPFLNGQ